MKKILIPTDFSERAENAADFAIRLFGKDQVEYIFCNAYYALPTTNTVEINVIEPLAEHSKEKLTEWQMKVAEKYDIDLNQLDTSSTYGMPKDAVLQYAEDHAIDCIVMGTKGASGLEGLFFGSNTLGVAKETKIPLISVPENSSWNDLSHIAIGLDKENLSASRLYLIRELAEKWKSNISLVHVHQPEGQLPTEILKKEEDFFEGLDVSLEVIEGKDIEETLAEFVHNKDIDLLVLVRRELNFLERLFQVSITRKFCLHAEVPVVVVPE